jgi:hypothetical protein
VGEGRATCGQDQQGEPTPVAHARGQGDDDARQQRQGLAHRLELLDHLGHHEHHQRDDHAHGGDRQGGRIDQGGDHLAARLFVPFEQVGQTLQDGGQGAGAFAGRDHGSVERRKGPRFARERRRQAMPLQHCGVDARQHLAHLWPVGLQGDGAQGFFQRRDRDQRRHLTGDQRQRLGAQPGPEHGEAGLIATAGSPRNQAGGHEPAALQLLAGGALGGRHDHPLTGAAAGVQGLIFKRRHRSSPDV